jgi:hypothetical protein
MSMLSDAQIDSIVVSWEEVKTKGYMTLAGQEMFLTLFKNAPHTLRIFRGFCDNPQWKDSPLFMFHCELVSSSIDTFITLLRDRETRNMRLMFLGLKHSHFDITYDHLMWMMSGLINCVNRVMGDRFDEPTCAAFDIMTKEFALVFVSSMARTEAIV